MASRTKSTRLAEPERWPVRLTKTARGFPRLNRDSKRADSERGLNLQRNEDRTVPAESKALCSGYRSFSCQDEFSEKFCRSSGPDRSRAMEVERDVAF